MAAYPSSTTLVFTRGTQVVAINNIALDVAEDGSVRGRKLHTKETYEVQIYHANMTEADANTVEEFYEANPDQVVDVTWRGATYNCRWAGKPVVEHAEGDTWNITSRLKGVRSDGL